MKQLGNSNLRYRRGAGVIVFIAILFPSALFGMALTVDHGRVLLASRQSADIADSVVMAAASARTGDGDVIEQPEAVNRALATFQRAKSYGMLSPSVEATLSPADIVFGSDGRTVKVTVKWEVTSLPLFKIFFPELTGIGGTSTRSARICIAELDDRPCAYPV
jgi:uncharacterized membrane protein